MPKLKLKKKLSELSIFDQPRPKYISKITFFDRVFQQTILRFVPSFVRPNFLTVFRFISIPFIAILLLAGDYEKGLCLFIFSALSDALDGALARTRQQITDWGIVFDPIADKLLIGTVAIIVVYKAVNPALAFFIVGLELIMVISAYFRFSGHIVPAKTSGKIKMILQSLGVGILLLGLVLSSPAYISVATYILYLSIVFSLLSLFIYRSI
jgi:CDP-diacylglycerol--glycerol-3-phosphate 3-phosphatidyltransferase